MNQLEDNIARSFRKVREDIENLQHQISELKEKVEDIDRVLLEKEKNNKKTVNPMKTAKKASKKKTKK